MVDKERIGNTSTLIQEVGKTPTQQLPTSIKTRFLNVGSSQQIFPVHNSSCTRSIPKLIPCAVPLHMRGHHRVWSSCLQWPFTIERDVYPVAIPPGTVPYTVVPSRFIPHEAVTTSVIPPCAMPSDGKPSVDVFLSGVVF